MHRAADARDPGCDDGGQRRRGSVPGFGRHRGHRLRGRAGAELHDVVLYTSTDGGVSFDTGTVVPATGALTADPYSGLLYPADLVRIGPNFFIAADDAEFAVSVFGSLQGAGFDTGAFVNRATTMAANPDGSGGLIVAYAAWSQTWDPSSHIAFFRDPPTGGAG